MSDRFLLRVLNTIWVAEQDRSRTLRMATSLPQLPRTDAQKQALERELMQSRGYLSGLKEALSYYQTTHLPDLCFDDDTLNAMSRVVTEMYGTNEDFVARWKGTQLLDLSQFDYPTLRALADSVADRFLTTEDDEVTRRTAHYVMSQWIIRIFDPDNR